MFSAASASLIWVSKLPVFFTEGKGAKAGGTCSLGVRGCVIIALDEVCRVVCAVGDLNLAGGRLVSKATVNPKPMVES